MTRKIKISNLSDVISVNKYYRMSDEELSREASNWKIRGYGDGQGYVQRQIIIDALLKRRQCQQCTICYQYFFIGSFGKHRKHINKKIINY